jgi:UDP-glucose 6-dehydrogenase
LNSFLSTYLFAILLAAGAIVRAYDPIANTIVEQHFRGQVEFFDRSYDALKDAEACWW